MQLPKLALKNYQFVLVLIAMATYIGISAIQNMPRNEDPNPKFPIYNIVAVYPGASPEDVEELVVNPLEEAVDQLDDILHITTIIEEGLAVIQVEAEFGIDIDDKYDEILREVKNEEPDLPDDLYSLEVSQFEPNKLVKIQQIALSAPDKSFREIEQVGEDLEKRLEKIKGVDDAELVAYPEELIKVEVDLQRMAAYNISINQLNGILTSQNLNIPAGDLAAGVKLFSVKSSGSFNSLEELKDIVISSTGNHIVYLRDIADVKFDYQEDNWIGRFNGERAIFITITQRTGNNLVAVGKTIQSELEQFQKTLPNGYSVNTVFEQGSAVEARINGFFWNLIQGVLLVGVIILLFLGLRPSLIIMTVIPLSIVIGIGILDMADYALQQISIAALVIALGLLVDNGIVVVENIQRYLKQGLNLKEAAVKGTSEVGYAIISSTATTVFAFFPLVFMQSGPGEFLRSLPLTVIFVLLVSLILAMTLTPMVSGKLLKSNSRAKFQFVDKSIGQFISKIYEPVLKFSLKRGWVIVTVGVVLLIGSVSLFPSIGVTFFPTADKPLLLIEVEAPRGSSLERTDKAVTFVEDVLSDFDYVDSYTSNIGHGNPTIYYNRAGENFKKYFGQLLVKFDEWDAQQFYQTLASLRKEFSKYPDARITFQELKNGPPVEAPIEVRLIGDDLNKMRAVSLQVESIMEETNGVIDIFNPLKSSKTDLKVAIDRDKAGMYGVPLVGIDQVMRVGVDGLTIDEVSVNQKDFDLMVQANINAESVPELAKIQFANRQGQHVPLMHMAQLKFQPAVSEIRHYDTDRSTSITASVSNLDQAIAKTQLIMNGIDELEFPEGITYEFGGEYESQQESFGDLGLLLILAMLGIFAILVLQFRSFTQPLIVFASIPLAITGSFVALYITGWSFSFFAFVGFISLVGIVVNNSIILVDYTNQLIRSGKEKYEAILEASKTRFTPIILTTVTTILGLVPLTFQGTNLWSPLGWTIIGGMISSTVLTLFVVPVLYQWFTKTSTVVVD